jgi:hypothetical protein
MSYDAMSPRVVITHDLVHLTPGMPAHVLHAMTTCLGSDHRSVPQDPNDRSRPEGGGRTFNSPVTRPIAACRFPRGGRCIIDLRQRVCQRAAAIVLLAIACS